QGYWGSFTYSNGRVTPQRSTLHLIGQLATYSRGPNCMCAQTLDRPDVIHDGALPEPLARAPTAAREQVDLPLVIPIYNEEGSIAELYATLSAVLSGQGCSYEILFVDDGSRDTTFSQLRALHADDHNVRVIRFRRNFGKTAALAAGFSNSRGEVVIT